MESGFQLIRKLIPKADADIPRGQHHVVILRNRLGNTRDIAELIMNNVIAAQGNGNAVYFVPDQLRRVNAKLRGQHPVICARAAAALNMARHNAAGFNPNHFLHLCGNALADAIVRQRRAERFAFLLLHFRFLNTQRAFGDGNDGKWFFAVGAGLHSLGNFLNVKGNFRYQDHIGAARDAGIEG